jgi:CBS domain containing-hemolysin-like protein
VSDLAALGLGIALLLGNAFFVGAEFAVISARRSQIEPLAAAGGRRARITLRGMERVSLMLAGAQLGITVCSLGLGAVAEPALAHLIEPVFEAVGVPAALVHPVAFAIALTVVVYLHIVLGEMVPKNLALAAPERSALWLGPLLWWVVLVLRPFIVLLNALANLGLRVVGVRPKDEVAAAFTAEEVANLIAESRREGMLAEGETQLAGGALQLVARPVEELVIPAGTLRSVRIDDPARAVVDATRDTGFSRFPVLAADGAPIAYLHVRDVLPSYADLTARVRDAPLRELEPIAAGATAAAAAELMRARGTHLAKVVRPDGTVVGVLALEDVLEELIGEVRDASHAP